MSLDYSGQNLRGKSFKGQNLTNADFSHADIRGANFTGAILKGANFSRAKAGLQKRKSIFLVFVSFLLAGLSGFSFAFTATFSLILLFDNSNNSYSNRVIGCFMIIILPIIIFIIVRRGIQVTLVAVAVVVVVVGGVTGGGGVLAVALAGFVTGADEGFVIAVTFALAIAIAIAIAGVIAMTLVGAGAGAVVVAEAGAGAGAVAVGLTGALAGVITLGLTGVRTMALALALPEVLVSAYIGWRAMKGDEKHAIIRNIAFAFAAFGGTSFRNTDLTDANFTLATLKNTDFRNANLTRTYLRNVRKIDYARLGNTYLKNAKLLEVLVTGNGRKKNFDRQDLRGINLQGEEVDLVDSSFIGADLSTANLKDSNLSRAKLVQTQLDATDFTGATLTGAYIEDWNITTHTNFRGVTCEYVYMRFPTNDNPDPWRKPDNREEVFGDGEFGDFIKPIVDTLDLYHNQGVDPRAIAISFKELVENNPDADLELVAMEKRGADKFLLRAKAAPEANKSELNQQYFETYNHLKTLSPEQQIEYYLNEISVKNKEIELQQKQIVSFENMVGTALGRPQMRVENWHNQGDVMSDKKSSTYNLEQAKFGGGFAGTGGNQSGGTLNDYSSDNNSSNNNVQMQTPNSNGIVCRECNYINSNNSKFCTKCGAKLT